MKCTQCGSELGLRERYERLLDLLESGLVIYDANNKFERDQQNPEMAQNVMQASIQMYDILGSYWTDIPGENISEKLKNVNEKRMYEINEDGKMVLKNVILQ